MNNYYFPNWWLDIVHLASRDSIACWSWPNSIFNFLVWVLPFVFYIFGLIFVPEYISPRFSLMPDVTGTKSWERNYKPSGTPRLPILLFLLIFSSFLIVSDNAFRTILKKHGDINIFVFSLTLVTLLQSFFHVYIGCGFSM